MRRELTNVLVVDDDETMRRLIGEVLSDASFEVYTAEDLEACRAVIRRHPVDAILLDLMIPGVESQALTAFTAEQEHPVPLVIVSAAHDIHARADELGAAAILPKPFDLDQLVDVVSRVTRRQAGEAGGGRRRASHRPRGRSR